MPKSFLGLCLIAVSAACGDSHGPGDAGVCVNEPACTCNDGRRGFKVCDVDTHEYVMCECDGSPASKLDAGTRSSGTQGAAADGGGNANPGRGAAGRMSVPNRPQAAAGSGSDAGASDAGTSARGGNGSSNGRGKGHGRR